LISSATESNTDAKFPSALVSFTWSLSVLLPEMQMAAAVDLLRLAPLHGQPVMSHLQIRTPDHRQIVEFIARTSSAPVTEVAELYAAEWDELSISAQVKSFLPIIVARRVKDILQQRGSQPHAPRTGRAVPNAPDLPHE
jgi:hypothetical protein